MTPEEKLHNRISRLVENTLNRLPVPRTFTYIIDKHIDPFAKEIVAMSKEYVEDKKREKDDG